MKTLLLTLAVLCAVAAPALAKGHHKGHAPAIVVAS